MLGGEPIESEIPTERSDLFLETQEVFNLYDCLPDRWDSMNGIYMGKDMSVLPALFQVFDVEKPDQYYAFSIIPVIDNFVAQDISRKQKSAKNSKGVNING